MWRIQLLYTTFKLIPINFGVLKIGWHMKYIASRNENVTTNFVMPNAKKIRTRILLADENISWHCRWLQARLMISAAPEVI